MRHLAVAMAAAGALLVAGCSGGASTFTRRDDDTTHYDDVRATDHSDAGGGDDDTGSRHDGAPNHNGNAGGHRHHAQGCADNPRAGACHGNTYDAPCHPAVLPAGNRVQSDGGRTLPDPSGGGKDCARGGAVRGRAWAGGRVRTQAEYPARLHPGALRSTGQPARLSAVRRALRGGAHLRGHSRPVREGPVRQGHQVVLLTTIAARLSTSNEPASADHACRCRAVVAAGPG